MPYVHKENATKFFSPELKSTQPPKKTWLQRLHLVKCKPWKKEYYSSEEYSSDMLIPELLIDVLAKSVPSPLEYVRLNLEEEAIKLGMQKKSRSQIHYIDISNGDSVEVLDSNK